MKTILAFLLSLSLASATDYYIDQTGGSDAANGLTTGTAWKTLSKAQGFTFSYGDNVFLKRGETWSESYTNSVSGQTWDAYGSGALPIIDGGNVRRNLWSIGLGGGSTVTNTTVRNLHLKNAGGGTGSCWVNWGNGTNTIENCVIQHNSDSGVSGADSSWMVVRNCYFYNIFDEAVTLHSAANAFVTGCTFTNCGSAINNSGAGTMTMIVENSLFVNNPVDINGLTVTDCTFNRCLFTGSVVSATSFYKGDSDLLCKFNYCVFDASHVVGGTSDGEFTPQGLGTTILNNCVLYAALAGGKISLAATTTLRATNTIFSGWRTVASTTTGTFTHDHCIIWNAVTTNWTSATAYINQVDPLFLSPTTGYFKPATNSVAINAGTPLGFTLDFVQQPVYNPPEIGAYEVLGLSLPRQTAVGFLIIGGKAEIR